MTAVLSTFSISAACIQVCVINDTTYNALSEFCPGTWPAYATSCSAIGEDCGTNGSGRCAVLSYTYEYPSGNSACNGQPIINKCSYSVPTTPTLSGTQSITTGADTSNFVTATDADVGDTIMYDVNWGDGTSIGTTGYAASGASVPIGHQYSTAGTYQVRAKARDSVGGVSAWSANFTITVTAASYNCESGSLNPGLGITTNNSLLGIALNSATHLFHSIFSNGTPACFRNTSSNNYFVPTKTQLERDAFINNLPPGVTKGGF